MPFLVFIYILTFLYLVEHACFYINTFQQWHTRREVVESLEDTITVKRRFKTKLDTINTHVPAGRNTRIDIHH